jgi:nicotinamidase/pyrazinamidase
VDGPPTAADAITADAADADAAAYDPSVALLVVDVQNDFADPAGSLYVPGGEAVVTAANGEVARALAAGARVAYTQDWHPPDTPHFAKDGGVWPVHCVRDTWGAELHPRLLVAGPVVRKGTGGEDGYSGFSVRDPLGSEVSSTGLAELLRSWGVERVVIAGLALDYCVRDTALDAVADGFGAAVLRAATAPVEVHEGDGQRAVEAMVDAGVQVA